MATATRPDTEEPETGTSQRSVQGPRLVPNRRPLIQMREEECLAPGQAHSKRLRTQLIGIGLLRAARTETHRKTPMGDDAIDGGV